MYLIFYTISPNDTSNSQEFVYDTSDVNDISFRGYNKTVESIEHTPYNDNNEDNPEEFEPFIPRISIKIDHNEAPKIINKQPPYLNTWIAKALRKREPP